MPHYKNTAGNIYWLDSDDQRGFLPSDCVPITDAEAEELLNPGPVPNPRVYEIKQRLGEVDLASIRAMRSQAVNRGKPEDALKLAQLDDEASLLRAELFTIPEFI